MEMTLWTNKDPINQHHHIMYPFFIGPLIDNIKKMGVAPAL